MDYTTSSYPASPIMDPVVGTVYWVFVVVITILTLVGMWKLFVKAGKPGWASLIPIYNIVVLMQIVGYSGWMVLLVLIPIVNIIVICMVYHRLSQAFGHGIGYTLGLIFLQPIFFLLLAFGDSKYTPLPKTLPSPTPAPPPSAPTPPPAKSA